MHWESWRCLTLVVPGTAFNLSGHSVIFTPSGNGWTVVDLPANLLLDDAALTLSGPLYDFKQQTLALRYPMLALGADMQDTLDSSLLHDVDRQLTLRTGLMRIADGGQLTYASSQPVASLNGGSYTIGETAAPAAMFDLAATTSGGRPLQGVNGDALGAPLLETRAATVDVPGDGGRLVRLDTALLEATAPLINCSREARSRWADTRWSSSGTSGSITPRRRRAGQARPQHPQRDERPSRQRRGRRAPHAR